MKLQVANHVGITLVHSPSSGDVTGLSKGGSVIALRVLTYGNAISTSHTHIFTEICIENGLPVISISGDKFFDSSVRFLTNVCNNRLEIGNRKLEL